MTLFVIDYPLIFADFILFFAFIQFVFTITYSYAGEIFIKNGYKLNDNIITIENIGLLTNLIFVLIFSIFSTQFIYALIFVFSSYFFSTTFNKISRKKQNYLLNFFEFIILIFCVLWTKEDYIYIVFILFYSSRYISSVICRLIYINLKISKTKKFFFQFKKLKNLDYKHIKNLIFKNFKEFDIIYLNLFLLPGLIVLYKYGKSVSTFINVFSGNIDLYYRDELNQKKTVFKILIISFLSLSIYCYLVYYQWDNIINYVNLIFGVDISSIESLELAGFIFLIHGLLFGGLRYQNLLNKEFKSSNFGILFGYLILLISPILIISFSIEIVLISGIIILSSSAAAYLYKMYYRKELGIEKMFKN